MRAPRTSPFACRIVSKAGCGHGQGSPMNSLRSALTAVLAGTTHPLTQAKGAPESRRFASDILTIELVQNTGLVTLSLEHFTAIMFWCRPAPK